MHLFIYIYNLYTHAYTCGMTPFPPCLKSAQELPPGFVEMHQPQSGQEFSRRLACLRVGYCFTWRGEKVKFQYGLLMIIKCIYL